MFSRKDGKPAPKLAKTGAPGLSFIGSEVVISGDVATSAQLHIDGRVDGCVRCAQLSQGATGVVAGDIVADEARIAGLVEGTVSGRTVIVESSACISGDIAYETISIAAGARIDGRLARREALASGELLIAAGPVEIEKKERPSGAAELFEAGQEKRAAVG